MAAPTLISTPGATDANSYVATIEEATELVNGPLSFLQVFDVPVSAWLSVGSPATEALTWALIIAAQRIDQIDVKGYRVDAGQARAWWRIDTTVPGADNTIPDAVKMAQVAEACTLLSRKDENAKAIDAGIIEFSIGQGEKSARLSESLASASASQNYSRAAEQILAAAGLTASGSTRAGSTYLARG